MGWKTAVLLAEPSVLLFGKGVNAILQSSLKEWVRVRELGHRGPVIEHYVWDRAGITALERNIRQWHMLRSAMTDQPGEDYTAADLALTEFIIVTPCAMHDAHNAFRWGFLSEVKNRDLMRDVYVSVESLRSSSDILGKHIGAWVATRVSLSSHRSEKWVDHRRRLLHALDLEPEVIELVASALQLRWEGGKLHVSDQHPCRLNLVGTIVGCLRAAWRFKKWSESRWLSVGTCSRVSVLGLLLGVPDFVNYIMQDTNSSLYFLKGYTRLTSEGKRFVVRASIASRVAEGVEAELMQDNRVALRIDELWAAATDELQWVVGLEDEIWRGLAELCDMDSDALKSSVIRASHISYHFMWRRFLSVAGDLPWRLVRGNRVANLEALKAGDCPAEPMSSKLWEMLRGGAAMPQMVAILDALGQAGWTTVPAEQQHGSLAAFKRWHPQYGSDMLATRALVGQLVRLLPSETRDERRAAQLIRKLKTLDGKQPQKAAGRQLFLKSIIAAAKRMRSGGAAGWEHVTEPTIRKQLFHRHVVTWAQQTMGQQVEWARRAHRAAGEKRAELHMEMDALTAELDVLDMRIAEDQEDTKGLCMSAAAFTAEDLALFGRLFHDEGFRSMPRIAALREEAMRTAQPLDKARHDALEAIRVWQLADIDMPAWAQQLADHRELVHDGAVGVVDTIGQTVQRWALVYMVQNPYYVAVAKLEEVDVARSSVGAGESLWYRLDMHPQSRYHCNFGNVQTAADIGCTNVKMMMFLGGLQYEGGTFMSTQELPMTLQTLLDQLPEQKVAPRKAGGAGRAGAHSSRQKVDDYVKEYPWLIHLDDNEGFAAGSTAAVEQDNAADNSDAAQDVTEEMVAMMAVKAMEAARAAYGGPLTEERQDCFVVVVLGDTPKNRREGKPPDAIQGQCSGGIADTFCRNRKLQVTFRAGFGRHHPDDCGILVRAWCHRMQFMLNTELSSGQGAAFNFSPASMAAYEEPAEFANLARESSAGTELYRRVAQIRSIMRL